MEEHNTNSRGRDEAMRVFKSDFLEFFTHIHPAFVLAVWLPIVGLFLTLGIFDQRMPLFPAGIPLYFVAGVFLWSLAEYVLHRFLFHYHAKSELGQKISFMFHGIHHAQPMVKTRLVMPPVVSIPLGGIFLGLYWLVFGLGLGSSGLTFTLFSGTAFGYLVYDMIHYSTHHFNLKNRAFKWIRSHHMKHHVQTPDMRFGVTSPLWDKVFGTEPGDTKKGAV